LKKVLLISCYFAILYPPLRAQNSGTSFDQYTTENGLSNNYCSSLVQDEDGFIWIATISGLNRFDGKDFVKYYGNGSQNQFPSNVINKMICLPNHRMAVATNSGLTIINTKTSKVQQLIIPAAPELEGITNRAENILSDKKGNIIVSTRCGVYVFNTELKLIFRFDYYKPEDVGKKRMLFSSQFYLLPDGRVLIFAGYIYLLDIQNRSLQDIKDIPGNEFDLLRWWSGKINYSVGINPHGLFYFIKSFLPADSLFVIDLPHQRSYASAIAFSMSKENWMSKIISLNDSLIALTTINPDNVYLLQFDKKKMATSPAKNILRGDFCIDMILDKNNRIWMASEKGLYKESFNKSVFNSISPQGQISVDVTDKTVNGFIHYQNKYFVNQNSTGTFVYDDSFHLIRNISFNKAGKNNLPWSISYYKKDTLLIATQEGAVLLNSVDYSLKKFWQPGMPPEIDNSAIISPFVDSHDQLWLGIGNGNGVFRMNLSTHAWKYFSPKSKDAIFNLRYPMSIGEDNNGNIWMSGAEGITRWNPLKQTFDTLITKLPRIGEITGERWNYFTTDSQNNLWILENDFVLVRWNLTTNKFVYFQRPDNLPPLYTNAIYGPWDNHLWIGTDKGLLTFNIKTEQFRLITKQNGFYVNVMGDYGSIYFDTATSRIFVGYNNVFNWFYSRDVLKRKKPVQTIITDIRKIGDSTSLAGDSSVSFSYKDNSFTVGFTGINYDDGENNTYAYRLFENKTTAFTKIGGQKTVTFASLKPGHYSLQVKTILPDGTESIRPTSLHINIAYPFYERWWFYLFCILSVAAGFYILYRYRINQLLQLQKIRNSISADLHDDIGARLTNINILSALGQQKTNNPHETSEYLNRISNEVQTSGEALDDIVWSIDTKNDPVLEITARMRRYAAEVFDGTAIQYSIVVNENILPAKLSMGKRRDLFLVFKEAINNIQKHAMATEVKINIEAKDNNLLMQVNDNGQGFHTDQPTHRNGLKNMQLRLQKWGGFYAVQSSPGKGTVLEIKLPVSNQSLKKGIWEWLTKR
jgi:ligand-binding sensor domain-containing protein/two-component sensor histidine kinase